MNALGLQDPIRAALRDQYIDTMVTASDGCFENYPITALSGTFAELAYLVDDMREHNLWRSFRH